MSRNIDRYGQIQLLAVIKNKLKIITLIVLTGTLTFNSCQEAKTTISTEISTSTDEHQSHVDTLTDGLIQLPEPVEISIVDKTKFLDYTSGGGPSDGSLCDSTKDGFYGFYSLIDKRLVSSDTNPIIGQLEIFKSGSDMSNWTSSDSDQEFRQISLRSDLIAVWDSIRVGIDREQLLEFIQHHHGLSVSKGNSFYSCEFGNYIASFQFYGDKLGELSVRKKCKK